MGASKSSLVDHIDPLLKQGAGLDHTLLHVKGVIRSLHLDGLKTVMHMQKFKALICLALL